MGIIKKGNPRKYQISQVNIDKINQAFSDAMNNTIKCNLCETEFKATKASDVYNNGIDISTMIDDITTIEFYSLCPMCGAKQTNVSIIIYEHSWLVKRYLQYIADIFEAEGLIRVYQEELNKKEKDDTYYSDYYLSRETLERQKRELQELLWKANRVEDENNKL